jgi:hypothetical protein
MKVSGEGYRSFAADQILTVRIFIRFLLHRQQLRVIFPLPPTTEHRGGMPKHQLGGDGTLLTVTALTDLRTRSVLVPHPPVLP